MKTSRWGYGVAALFGLFCLVIVIGSLSSRGRAPSLMRQNQRAATPSAADPLVRPMTPAEIQASEAEDLARQQRHRAETSELALLSATGYTEHGYHHVAGQVRNASTARLENVTAVATWFTEAGAFVKTDQTLIGLNPILPGQTSSFDVMTTANPASHHYTVEFKVLFGRALLVDDQRKR